MKRDQLSKVICNIDERQIAEAYQFNPDLCSDSPERIVHMSKKRIFTFALAAALILSLGIAAYAAFFSMTVSTGSRIQAGISTGAMQNWQSRFRKRQKVKK